MQSGIKEKDEKDKKKQDVKYPDYWDGNIYICGSIFYLRQWQFLLFTALEFKRKRCIL